MVNYRQRHVEQVHSTIYVNKSVLSVGLFLFIFTIIAFFQIPSGTDITLLISFFINSLVFSLGILTAVHRYSYSLNLIFWIFMYFFMFFAPLMQYAYNMFPLKFVEIPSENEIFTANLAILVFCILWFVGKTLFYKKLPNNLQKSKLTSFLVDEYEHSHTYNIGFMFIFFVCIILTLYFLFRNGFSGIIVQRENSGVAKFYGGNNQAVSSVAFSLTVGAFAFAIMAFASAAGKKCGSYTATTSLLVMLLICYFPTTIPRFTVATIYFGILIVLFRSMRRGNLFFWTFILGLFVIFPFLNSFRYTTDVSFSEFFNTFSDNFFQSYTEGHYDAYLSLINTFRFVRQKGITFGRQLLGAVLFFLPRTIWKNKPTGSGAYVIDTLAPGSFSNVSCTFIGECYINFGIIGIASIPLILGYYFTKLDYLYHDKKDVNSEGVAPYVFFILLFFFILRGDLMSSFSYSVGFLFTGYIVKLLLKTK